MGNQTPEAQAARGADWTDPEAVMDVSRALLGEIDGRPVELIGLRNPGGMAVQIITLGASLHSLLVPDRRGQMDDVIVGPATLDGYRAKRHYFGATVGRVANRIAGGRFVLDGREYQIGINDGANALHGGPNGFDQAIWEVVALERGPPARLILRHVSPDGDQGYPGTLTVTAAFSLDMANVLTIAYRATTDRPTIVNISNHTYWNLAGEGASCGAMGHLLTIPADHYMPTDAGAIPTGEIRPVAGTAFDFRHPRIIGAGVRQAEQQILFGRGYDHNWMVDRAIAADPRLLARVYEPTSGRRLDLLSNQPGLQFYSGNFLDGTTVGKSGRVYRQGDAIVLEPQMFPDTPNRPAFGSVRLDPGETYSTIITLRFSTSDEAGLTG